MFKTSKGHSWACGDKKCLAAVDSRVAQGFAAEDLLHCGYPNCHEIFIDGTDGGGHQCVKCKVWHCDGCAESYGDVRDDSTYICENDYEEDD